MPPKAKKPAATSSDNAEQLILNYLRQKNRPYSANDIFTNLHGAVGKTAVPKVLAALAQAGEITEKQFNKTKLYVARQDLIEPPSQEQLDEMDARIIELKETLVAMKERQKSLLAMQQSLNSSLTLDEALERISTLRKKNQEMESKVQELQSGTRKVDPVQKQEVDRLYDLSSKEWKKRKKICMEIVHMLCESSGQKPNEFFEELGLEQDPQ